LKRSEVEVLPAIPCQQEPHCPVAQGTVAVVEDQGWGRPVGSGLPSSLNHILTCSIPASMKMPSSATNPKRRYSPLACTWAWRTKVEQPWVRASARVAATNAAPTPQPRASGTTANRSSFAEPSARTRHRAVPTAPSGLPPPNPSPSSHASRCRAPASCSSHSSAGGQACSSTKTR
jgi:hypothetical protein